MTDGIIVAALLVDHLTPKLSDKKDNRGIYTSIQLGYYGELKTTL
jgi:hypothetical protein